MVFDKLKEIIAELFTIDADDISDDTTFSDDLEADSFDIEDLVMMLQDEFGVPVDEDQDMEMRALATVGEVADFIGAKLEASEV